MQWIFIKIDMFTIVMFCIISPGTRPYDSSVINYTSVGVATSAAVRGHQLHQLRHCTCNRLSGTLEFSDVSLGYHRHDSAHCFWTSLGGVSQFRISLGLEWSRIQDMQSEIVELEWSLGTRPYSGDLSGWNEFNGNGGGTGMRISTGQLPLYEGQRVFASVKVSLCVCEVMMEL